MAAYLLKTTLCWIVLYVVYQMGWKQERAFLSNRLYLLGALFLGVVLPLLSWEAPMLSDTLIPWEAVNNLTSVNANTNLSTTVTWDWQDGIWGLYGLGVLVAVLLFHRQLLQLRNWYQRGTKTHYADYTLVELPGSVPPFSFGRCLFVGADLRQNTTAWPLIQRHELAHIQQYHTWDVLALSLLRVVFWFHPILWLYQQALRDQHEYAADAVVLQHSSIAQYGRLLLHQSITYTPNALAHLFFHSPLKKRILMMTNKQQGQRPFIKYSLSLLTVALLSWQVSAQSNTLVDKPDTAPYPIMTTCTNDDEAHQCATQAFLKFIYTHIKYPEEAKKANKEGRVVISFVVKRNGKIEHTAVVKKVDPQLDEEALRVIRLVQKEFQWAPATKDGKKVHAKMTIPLQFKLK